MKKIITLSLIFASSLSYGYTKETGKITNIQVHQFPREAPSSERLDQRFFVHLNSTISGESCAQDDRWFGYLNTDAGRAQYSTILAAYMAGKKVTLEATNSQSCTSGSMLIRNIYLSD